MNIWNSKTYLSDLDAASNVMDLYPFKKKKFLITGATGLIASAIVDFLIYINKYKNIGCTIFVAGRNTDELKARFIEGKDYGIIPVKYDATANIEFDYCVDYIIHAAGNASPDKYISDPVGTMLANIDGIKNLLDYAYKNKTKKVVYISSSEVYGKLNKLDPIKETDRGFTDFYSLRSAYPIGKQSAEFLCLSYAERYGVDVSVVRPGHIYGPTSKASDNRVSSLFMREAVSGNNIIMKSSGNQIRSYCYCVDCLTAILTVLTNGISGEAYNISNKSSIITIKQMAETICKYARVNLIMDIPSDIEKTAFNPMENSSLNSDKIEAIGWKGIFDYEDGIQHTINTLKEIN